MFCTRCGKENRDDASFCVQCGASLGQISGVQLPKKPPGIKRTLWIIGIAVFVVALVAVHEWALHRSDQPEHVIVDGATLVGANDKPIELFKNSAAKDVTWTQLKQFLLSDQTDRIQYNDSTFVCGNFAETLYNDAEKAGIKAGFVAIDFGSGLPLHACNVFQTTDRGIVYIDDTGTTSGSVNADKTVDLEIGKSYCPVGIFSNPGHEVTWECMGTVYSFQVTW
jgi:ferredoxin